MSSFAGVAQDRVYLLDGSCKVVKVLEIASEQITVVPLSESGAPFVDANETISKRDLLLIEYKNGLVEVYNRPEKTAIYNSDGRLNKKSHGNSKDISYYNFASLNTLALCNSDISGFYEHLVHSKKLGAGAMGAYNFNRYAGLQNALIAILPNAKKNYDIGLFLNLYPSGFKRRATFFYGVLFKYTSFKFTKVIEEKVGSAINISYAPAKGSQLATIFTVGIQIKITPTFFLKTMAGLGGFNMRGDYREQYNYQLNANRKTGDPVINAKFLPKFYFGLNAGFNF
jgi:hypothetical protein